MLLLYIFNTTGAGGPWYGEIDANGRVSQRRTK